MVTDLQNNKNAELVTLYGMTDEQKKTAVYVGAGVLTGVALFFVIRYYRKRKAKQ